MSYLWMTPLRAALFMVVCANPVLAQEGQGSAPVVGTAPVTLVPSPAFPAPAGWVQAMPTGAQSAYYVMPYMPQQQIWPMQPMPAIPPGWIPFVMVLMPMPVQGVSAQVMTPAMPLPPASPAQPVVVSPDAVTAPVVAAPATPQVSEPTPVAEVMPVSPPQPEVPPAIMAQVPPTPEAAASPSPAAVPELAPASAPRDSVATEPVNVPTAPVVEATAPSVEAVVPAASDAPAAVASATPVTQVNYGPIARTPVKWLVTRRAGARAAVKKPRSHVAPAVRPVAAKPAPAKKRLCWSNGVVGPCT